MFSNIRKYIVKLIYFVSKMTILTMIRLYQLLLSPIVGRQCRFVPSCSEYATLAINKHGLLKGLFLSVKRILRCSSYSKNSHGVDLP